MKARWQRHDRKLLYPWGYRMTKNNLDFSEQIENTLGKNREFGYVIALGILVLLVITGGVFAKPTMVVEATIDQVEDPAWFWGSIRTHNFSSLNISYGEQNNEGVYEYITREAYAKLIYDTFGLKDEYVAEPTFSDIPDYHRSYAYIEATKAYLTAFYPPKGRPFFAPEQYVTREDVISSLVRVMELSTRNGEDLAAEADEIQQDYFLLDYNSITPQLRFDVMQALVTGLVEPIGEEGSYRINPRGYIDKTEALKLLYGALKSSNASNKLDEGDVYLELRMPETTDNGIVNIAGSTAIGNEIYINDEKIESLRTSGFNTNVEFSKNFTLPSEGLFDFEIKIVDINGREKTVTRSVAYHLTGSGIEIYNEEDVVYRADYILNGRIRHEETIAFMTYLNGMPIEVDEDGFFNAQITLTPGENVFKVELVGTDGVMKEATKTVVFRPKAPEIFGLTVPKTTEGSQLRLAGNLVDSNDEAPRLFINGEQVDIVENGAFEKQISLAIGMNTITITTENKYGATSDQIFEIERARQKPKLEVEMKDFSTANPLEITGKILGDEIKTSEITVMVNNELAKVYKGNTFGYLLPLQPGENHVTIVLSITGMEDVIVERTVLFKETSPQITISAPKTTKMDRTVISGTIQDVDISQVKVEVNGVRVAVDQNGIWRCVAYLEPGQNEIIVVAENKYNKTSYVKTIVIRE